MKLWLSSLFFKNINQNKRQQGENKDYFLQCSDWTIRNMRFSWSVTSATVFCRVWNWCLLFLLYTQYVCIYHVCVLDETELCVCCSSPFQSRQMCRVHFTSAVSQQCSCMISLLWSTRTHTHTHIHVQACRHTACKLQLIQCIYRTWTCIGPQFVTWFSGCVTSDILTCIHFSYRKNK